MPKLADLIPAVIFDWAGTTVDHGCLAPVLALQSVLARHSIPAATEELRIGMGLPKRDHLRAILSPHGAIELTEKLYPELEQELLVQGAARADLIPGVAEVAAWLQSEDVRIGTTTGYPASMMALIAPRAADQGYRPDAIVTPDEVAAGRPSPLMIYANALRLGRWPLGSMVKVGDTPSDIAEGRNAGTWTVGVALSGNALGLSARELDRLPAASRSACCSAARASLAAAGADEVIDDVTALPGALERIARAVAAGRRPA